MFLNESDSIMSSNVTYTASDNSVITWYEEHMVNPYVGSEGVFEISEPKDFGNGLTYWEIAYVHDDRTNVTVHPDGSMTYDIVERRDYTYVMDYYVDENAFVQISVNSFARGWIANNPEEELKVLLDFYYAVEDPVIVVEKDAPVTIVRD